MGGRLRDRLRIEDGLRRALERDELRLVYQPIVDARAAARGRRRGARALAAPRARACSRPGRFLPVAEQHGRLISAIGDWVLRRACTEAGRWPSGVRVSINVAARELGEPGFAERVARTLAAAGVDARADRARDHRDDADGGRRGGDRRASRRSRGSACRSTSTTSAPATRRSRGSRALPLAGIKLDRGFVARAAGERDRRIIEAALSIGRAAELGVVAEGVETEDQLELLRAVRLPLRAGLPARAARAARAGGATAHWMSPVSCRYSLATSAGLLLVEVDARVELLHRVVGQRLLDQVDRLRQVRPGGVGRLLLHHAASGCRAGTCPCRPRAGPRRCA